MNRKLFSWYGLALVVVAVLAINIISYTTLRAARVDLTENKLYTLSPGTRSILKSLNEPITLKFYYSRKVASANVPGLATFVTQIQDLLEEYRDNSNGMIRLEIIDPEPFSEEEDEAALAGLQSVPVGRAGQSVFLGLVGRNQVDEVRLIPFFDPSKEPFLEYELTRLVYDLNNPRQKTVGILSSLPVMGTDDPLAMLRQQNEAAQPWMIVRQLQQSYEVRSIPPSATSIDSDIDVLLIVHPKALSDATLYAIDQYVLGGGRTVAFLDVHAEVDEPAPDPSNPYASLWADRSSSLGPLLDAWGLQMVENRFAADRTFARQVTVTDRVGRASASSYVAYLGVTGEEALNMEDVVTSGLGELSFLISGILEKRDDATTTITPLLQTSTDFMPADIDMVKFAPRAQELLANFESEERQAILAARISGLANSAYPDGPPGASDEEPSPAHRAEGNVNLVVVADVDFLSDRAWVRVQNFFGSRVAMPFASNGDFVFNAVENLTGSDDLLSVRSRGRVVRPFTRVEQITREAEAKHRAREAELEARMQELQAHLNELQMARSDTGSLTMMLTPEQEAAINEANEEYVNTRRELRRVRHELERDVEQLGTRLKIINIALLPMLIGLYAVVLGIVRENRRKG